MQNKSLATALTLCLAQATFSSCKSPDTKRKIADDSPEPPVAQAAANFDGRGDLKGFSLPVFPLNDLLTSSDSQLSTVSEKRITPEVLAIRKALPSVVNIEGERQPSPPSEPGEGLSVAMKGLGSGVIVDRHGYIITNCHVIFGMVEIQVTDYKQESYVAKVIYIDKSRDIALIKIDSQEDFKPATITSSTDLMLGETTIVIGNPYGYPSSVSKGIISAVMRDVETEGGFVYSDVIQTDAAINPGNSGGALFNINGEVVGICSAVRTEAQGIGFAIPIDQVMDLFDHVEK